jgi:hypothetical protein
MKIRAFAACVCAGIGAQAGLGASAQIEPGQDHAVLIMEPKVEVVFITTGGAEPRADWTETATANLMTELKAELERSGETIMTYEPAAEPDDKLTQLNLLSEVVFGTLVGNTNLNNGEITGFMLPHRKGQKADYTLGPDAALLAQGYEGADYALFFNSYSQIESGGSFLAKVAIGAVTGYVPATANIRGHGLMLIDLETGDAAWSSSAFGSDPRQPNEAKSVITNLFKKSPLR